VEAFAGQFSADCGKCGARSNANVSVVRLPGESNDSVLDSVRKASCDTADAEASLELIETGDAAEPGPDGEVVVVRSPLRARRAAGRGVCEDGASRSVDSGSVKKKTSPVLTSSIAILPSKRCTFDALPVK
jgi:hypothetical protein